MKTRKSKTRKNKTLKNKTLKNKTLKNMVKLYPKLTIQAAKIAADAMEKYAQKENILISFCIVDNTGYPIMLQRYNDNPATSDICRRKAQTAAIFGKPSSDYEVDINKNRPAFITAGYMMMRGGVPIVINGMNCGAIGVSGAKSSFQDETISKIGIKAITNN